MKRSRGQEEKKQPTKSEIIDKVRKWSKNIANSTPAWKLKRMLQDYDEIYAGIREIGYNGEANITEIKEFIRVQARKEGIMVTRFTDDQYLKLIGILWKLINKWEISFHDVNEIQIFNND